MQRSEVDALIRKHLRKYALKDEIASVGPFTSNSAIATDADGELVEATGVSKTELERIAGITTFGESLVNDAAASNARSTLGLGSAALNDTDDFLTKIPLSRVI